MARKVHIITSRMRAPVYTFFHSPLGWIGLAAHAHGLICVTVPSPSRRLLRAELKAHGATRPGMNRPLRVARRALEAYFADPLHADLGKLDLDLAHATAFERAVERRSGGTSVARRIPPGETRSYGAIARALGRPHAARAVGRCNAKNPFAIVVPCHRVVGSDGSLRGYSGGLEMKKRLLELEGIDLAALRAIKLVAGPVRKRRAYAHRH